MILAINIGNTNCSIGVFASHQSDKGPPRTQPTVLYKTQIPTHSIPPSQEELGSLLEKQIHSFAGHQEYKKVAVSVVPRFTELLEKDPSCHLLTRNSPYSFTVDERYLNVGVDRLVNLEAALCLFNSSCIVVDAGTATTFSVLKKNKRRADFLGGAIAPGLTTSIEALLSKTSISQKNSISLSQLWTASGPHIGGDTQLALQSGCVLGHARMIDAMIFEMRKELGEGKIPVILTGGGAQTLFALSQEVTENQPDLTLLGIAYAYERVRNS